MYSGNFSKVIAKMLTVTPSKRPTASQILQFKEMSVNMTETVHKLSVHEEEKTPHLLGTIQVPRNLRQLDKRLPGPNYNKRALKRMNSEQIRLPSIDKSRDNLRSAADEIVHSNNIPQVKELRRQHSEVPRRPGDSRRGNRYSRNENRYHSKENRVESRGGIYPLPSARGDQRQKLEKYVNPNGQRNKPL